MPRNEAMQMISFLDLLMQSDRVIIMINNEVVEMEEAARKLMPDVLASFAVMNDITKNQVEEYLDSLEEEGSVH